MNFISINGDTTHSGKEHWGEGKARATQLLNQQGATMLFLTHLTLFHVLVCLKWADSTSPTLDTQLLLHGFRPERVNLQCTVSTDMMTLSRLVIANDNGYSVEVSYTQRAGNHTCGELVLYETPKDPQLYRIAGDLLDSDQVFNKEITLCGVTDGHPWLEVEISNPKLPLLQQWRCDAYGLGDKTPTATEHFTNIIDTLPGTRPTVSLHGSLHGESRSAEQSNRLALSCVLEVRRQTWNIFPMMWGNDTTLVARFDTAHVPTIDEVVKVSYDGSPTTVERYTGVFTLNSSFDPHSFDTTKEFVSCEIGGYVSQNRSYESLLQESICFPVKSEPHIMPIDTIDPSTSRHMLTVKCKQHPRCSPLAWHKIGYSLQDNNHVSAETRYLPNGSPITNVTSSECDNSGKICRSYSYSMPSLLPDLVTANNRILQANCSYRGNGASEFVHGPWSSTHCSIGADSIALVRNGSHVKCLFVATDPLHECEHPNLQLLHHHYGGRTMRIACEGGGGEDMIDCLRTNESFATQLWFNESTAYMGDVEFTCRGIYPSQMRQVTAPYSEIPMQCKLQITPMRPIVHRSGESVRIECLRCETDTPVGKRNIYLWSGERNTSGAMNWNLIRQWEMSNDVVNKYVYEGTEWLSNEPPSSSTSPESQHPYFTCSISELPTIPEGFPPHTLITLSTTKGNGTPKDPEQRHKSDHALSPLSIALVIMGTTVAVTFIVLLACRLPNMIKKARSSLDT